MPHNIDGLIYTQASVAIGIRNVHRECGVVTNHRPRIRGLYTCRASGKIHLATKFCVMIDDQQNLQACSIINIHTRTLGTFELLDPRGESSRMGVYKFILTFWSKYSLYTHVDDVAMHVGVATLGRTSMHS